MTDEDINHIKALSTEVLEELLEHLNDSRCIVYCNSCKLCYGVYCICDIIRWELGKR